MEFYYRGDLKPDTDGNFEDYFSIFRMENLWDNNTLSWPKKNTCLILITYAVRILWSSL